MYEAEISRSNPALILFLFDCSYSMSERYGSTGLTKGQYLTRLCNESIDQVILSCEKGDEIRAYFHIGVLGYGDSATALVPIQSVVDLAYHPLRFTRSEIDGIEVKVPMWLEDPTAKVNTDMAAGFRLAKKALTQWIIQHGGSFPPVLIHVSDGVWTTENPTGIAKEILSGVCTADGSAIVLNIHISGKDEETLAFPARLTAGTEHQLALFAMSSVLPDPFFRRATEIYPFVEVGARGYMFNAQPKDLSKFFDIGTRLRG
ncbi:MAG: VWA domain-containing protein [Candidatus Schekmanbacteria bacterium]|nr:VWA domain-containing protein [Candidatus Schekmanbacteria bacterium]